jgi:hypothetical protein
MMIANCKRSKRSSACRLENFSRLRGALRPRGPFFGAPRYLPDRLGEGPLTEPTADTRACRWELVKMPQGGRSSPLNEDADFRLANGINDDIDPCRAIRSPLRR